MERETIIAFFRRDIITVVNEINAYPDEDSLWAVLPGTTNSGGHMVQHLIGNLKTFIGNPLGQLGYERNREAEFTVRSYSRSELITLLGEVSHLIESAVSSITAESLDQPYPGEIKSSSAGQHTGDILVHLLAHLSYHTGQLNYHRRFFTNA